MSDFKFIKNNNIWTILAPRRAKRPDEIEKKNLTCPFENPPAEQIFKKYDDVLVLKNIYPFAPIHEIIVHSSDHHRNFDELPETQIKKIFQVFINRFNLHKEKGNVVIFNNFGLDAGASIAHPHSQLVVTPFDVNLDIPVYPMTSGDPGEIFELTDLAYKIVCPISAQWPDEVWVIPTFNAKSFGELEDKNRDDLAVILRHLIQLLDMRHGEDFSYNFYISPLSPFYLRITPRQKKIGGFELATNIFVNTQNPAETLEFIKKHWDLENINISEEYKAMYEKEV